MCPAPGEGRFLAKVKTQICASLQQREGHGWTWGGSCPFGKPGPACPLSSGRWAGRGRGWVGRQVPELLVVHVTSRHVPSYLTASHHVTLLMLAVVSCRPPCQPHGSAQLASSLCRKPLCRGVGRGCLMRGSSPPVLRKTEEEGGCWTPLSGVFSAHSSACSPFFPSPSRLLFPSITSVLPLSPPPLIQPTLVGSLFPELFPPPVAFPSPSGSFPPPLLPLVVFPASASTLADVRFPLSRDAGAAGAGSVVVPGPAESVPLKAELPSK